MKKAVIFDMDGLMFDTETLSVDIWVYAAKKQDYKMPRDIALNMLGLNKEQIHNAFREYFKDNTKFDVDRYMDDYYEYMGEYLFNDGPEKKYYIEEILKYLKENNIPVAVASSSEKEYINNNLEKTKLTGYIDEIVSGCEVKKSKPNPDIFLKVAEKLSVNPDECIVLEDSKNGILAGNSAGMTVIMVPDLYKAEENIKEKIDYIAKDLFEAKNIIENLIG